MASLFRVSLPDRLQSVLDMRSSVSASDCPPDIQAAMSKLSFFHSTTASVPPAPSSSRFTGRLGATSGGGGGGGSSTGGSSGAGGGGGRFSHLSGSSSWRPTQSSTVTDDDGFQTYTRRRNGGGQARSSHGGGGGRENGRYSEGRSGGGGGSAKTGTWGGGGHGRYWNQGGKHASTTSGTATSSVPSTTTTAAMGGAGASSREDSVTSSLPTTTTTPAPKTPAAPESPTTTTIAFSSAAVKANIATEERILAKVKGKINKIGPSTYDATKTFMQQILDSDETDFLDDFMKFVFQKAATEAAFCPLYARLLHELADEFTHLRDVMRKLFHDYTIIFTEVDPVAPDPSSETYKEFVESQERKKFRRGYSQFVAEMVKLGEVDVEAFRTLLVQIVSVIESFHTDSGKTQLSEEYIDCLSNMCKSASPILVANAWSAELIPRLAALVAKPAAALPGFTSKARFALMNLGDYARRGWK